MGDEDVMTLAAALEKNAAITPCYLEGNSIGDEGAMTLAVPTEELITLLISRGGVPTKGYRIDQISCVHHSIDQYTLPL